MDKLISKTSCGLWVIDYTLVPSYTCLGAELPWKLYSNLTYISLQREHKQVSGISSGAGLPPPKLNVKLFNILHEPQKIRSMEWLYHSTTRLEAVQLIAFRSRISVLYRPARVFVSSESALPLMFEETLPNIRGESYLTGSPFVRHGLFRGEGDLVHLDWVEYRTQQRKQNCPWDRNGILPFKSLL